MIEVKDLKFTYRNGNEVLKGISFDCEDDCVISLLGPNGTGKTTFLKCLCGLQKPTEGSIKVNGKDVTTLKGKELAKEIGFVPQTTPVSNMSVFDAILVGRKPYIEWMAREEDIDKVADIIASLGMEKLALRNLSEISGGEFQKVQIARAIVQEPSLIVLDEPTNNLDIANQHRTMHMIMDVVRSRKVCTMMTMHDINLAVHYSDKFIFFKDGLVQAYGGPEVITADLIKSIYGFDVEVIDHRGVPLVVPKESAMYHVTSHHHPHDIHDHMHDHGLFENTENVL